VNQFTQKIAEGIQYIQRNKIWFGIGFTGLVIIAAATGIFIQITAEKERELSFRVNTLGMEVRNLLHKEERMPEEDERITAVDGLLEKIYNDNPRTKNGKRALFYAAGINAAQQNFELAKKRYLTVYNSDKNFFLSPQSLLFAAICEEDGGNFKEAVTLLEKFRSQYFKDPLAAEALLALARNLIFTGQTGDAASIYQEILQSKDYQAYAARAEREIKMLRLKGLDVLPSAAPDPQFNPGGFGSPGALPVNK